MHPLDTLTDIYEHRAQRAYGLEGVSQLEHALQSAQLARDAGCGVPLVVAALLHDVGHMIHDLGDAPAEFGNDDRHQELGARYLERWFDHDVIQPIRLHVAAKRYLVATEPDYASGLSRDSTLSLQLQGGPMEGHELKGFADQPHHSDALALRRFDDMAKVPGASTAPFSAYLPLLERCLLDEDR